MFFLNRLLVHCRHVNIVQEVNETLVALGSVVLSRLLFKILLQHLLCCVRGVVVIK